MFKILFSFIVYLMRFIMYFSHWLCLLFFKKRFNIYSILIIYKNKKNKINELELLVKTLYRYYIIYYLYSFIIIIIDTRMTRS